MVVLPALEGVGEVSMAELTQEKKVSGGLVESPGEAGFPETHVSYGCPLLCQVSQSWVFTLFHAARGRLWMLGHCRV